MQLFMQNLNLISGWFIRPYMILEALFALMTLIVSLYAMHIYFLSGQKQLKQFGLSFLLISAAYMIESLVNFNVVEKLNLLLEKAIPMGNAVPFNLLWLVASMILYLLGIFTLMYTTLQIKSIKTYLFIVISLLLSMAFATDKFFVYYLFISIMLIYIVQHYIDNTLRYRELKTLLVLVAFIFLLFSNIPPLLSIPESVVGIYIIIAVIIEFIAYALILLNLILVVKNE
jgi:hypothetical protein